MCSTFLSAIERNLILKSKIKASKKTDLYVEQKIVNILKLSKKDMKGTQNICSDKFMAYLLLLLKESYPD